MTDSERNEQRTCSVCKAWLSQRYHHINGKDYCHEHAKSVPRHQNGIFDEEVRGTIIGAITTRYQFWRGDQKLTETDAENDGEAVEWFRKNHPEQFKLGAEMRALDE